MATEKQKNASRANGAKSKGPTTPEGKARVAQNPIRHGLASKAVVLSNESTGEYEALAQSYRDQWQPKNQTEDDLVTQLINAQWRLRRIAAMETATLDLEMELRRKPFDDAVPAASEEMRISDAFLSVALHNGLSLDQLSRYETRYSNLYHRALKALQLLRRTQNCTSKPEQPTPEPTTVTQPTQTNSTSPPTQNCTSKPEQPTPQPTLVTHPPTPTNPLIPTPPTTTPLPPKAPNANRPAPGFNPGAKFPKPKEAA